MVRGGRWVKDAIINSEQRRTSVFFESLRKVNDSFILQKNKQIFFPGSDPYNTTLNITSRLILECDCLFKIIWDILVLGVTIFISYSIPFSISFYVDFGKKFSILLGCLYFSDILLTFNTSYYSKGFSVDNRLKIAKHYFKNSFFLDLISSFPFELLFPELDYNEDFPVFTDIQNRNILRYLMLLKLIRLRKYRNIIFNIRELFPYPLVFTLTSILSYLFYASLTLHLLACLQNVLYTNSLFTSHLNYEFVFMDRKTRYLKLVIRTMETITSVGYGEFPTRTNLERLFLIFIMTLTSGLFGYYVGGIQSFLEKSNQVDLYFNDVMRKTKIYMRVNKCPLALRSRVINYIRNLKQLHSENLLREQDILSLLSVPMKEEVFARIQGHYLLRIREFRRISSACLKAISDKLKLQMFGPNDMILTQGELTFDLYFIVGGSVEVFHRQTKTMYKILGSHSYFGEISFFCEKPRTASVKSSDYCELLSFHNIDFKKILKSHPKDKEFVDVFVRNVSIYGLSIMNLRCYLCEEPGHCALYCEKFVYFRGKMKVVKRQNLIPKPKKGSEFFIRPDEFFKRYRVRNTKSQLPGHQFQDNVYLKDAADGYLIWVGSADKQTSSLLGLMKSMENIPEENEEDSLESWDDLVELHMSKTQKIQTSVFEACDTLSPVSGLKRSHAILVDKINV